MTRNPFVAMVIAVIAALALTGLFLWPQAAAADGATFTVDSAGDAPDSNPGDCVCATSGGECTLRAAIQEANACSGGQTIRFSSAPMLIYPSSALPPLTSDHTVIDGSDRWVTAGSYEYPGINLEGDGNPFHGLQIQCSYCAVYGLMVTGFGYHGIYVSGGAQYSEIGGNGFHQRNVVSVNGWNGIRIDGTSTTSNTVVGNYVGTNPVGTADVWEGLPNWGNGWHGISVWNGSGNRVSDNLVGGNGWSGITADSLDGVLITSNRIGMSVDSQPLGNTYYGIHIGNGAQDVSVLSNTIAFNQRGIYVTGSGSSATIEHNTIYSNTALALSPPQGGGIFVANGSLGFIQYNDILSNTARYGGGVAIEAPSQAVVFFNTVQGNRAIISGAVPLGGGGIYVLGSNFVWIAENQVLSNTVAGDPEAASSPSGGGILFEDVTYGAIDGNEIRGNAVAGTGGGGAGVRIIGGSDILISNNRITKNTSGVWAYNGGGIDINSHHASSGEVEVLANWIAENSSTGGAVFVGASGGVVLENNVIARNEFAGLYVSGSTEWVTSTNNTIAQSGGNGITLDGASLALRNTIVASSGGYGLYGTGTFTLEFARNDVWDNGVGATNLPIGFFLEEDPLFFDVTAGRYGLRAGSPCIDVAEALYAPSESYNGLARPQGDGPDIGAYEMAPPVHLPLVMRNA